MPEVRGDEKVLASDWRRADGTRVFGWVRPLVLLVTISFAIGCFALDEMDEGMKRWKANSPSPEAPAAEPQTSTPTSPRRRTAAWDGVRSLSSESTPSDIIRCAVDGRQQYMRESECLSRGGEVTSEGT